MGTCVTNLMLKKNSKYIKLRDYTVKFDYFFFILFKLYDNTNVNLITQYIYLKLKYNFILNLMKKFIFFFFLLDLIFSLNIKSN